MGLTLAPRKANAQTQRFERTSCAKFSDPDWGAHIINYGGRLWTFEIDFALVNVSSTGVGTYTGIPDPATSVDKDSQGRSLKWSTVGVRIECYYRITEYPDGRKVITEIFQPIETLGSFEYVGGTDGGDTTQACDENGNPVDEGGDPANCDPGSTGGGDSGTIGSGIQYYPGDYTNGETVDFHTGIGNGGESVCGAAAQVEAITLELWDDNTGKWGEPTPGYATTC